MFLVRNTRFSRLRGWEKMLQDLHVAGVQAGFGFIYVCRGLAHRAATILAGEKGDE